MLSTVTTRCVLSVSTVHSRTDFNAKFSDRTKVFPRCILLHVRYSGKSNNGVPYVHHLHGFNGLLLQDGLAHAVM